MFKIEFCQLWFWKTWKKYSKSKNFVGLDDVQLQYEQYAENCDKKTKELVDSMSKELQVSQNIRSQILLQFTFEGPLWVRPHLSTSPFLSSRAGLAGQDKSWWFARPVCHTSAQVPEHQVSEINI